MLTEFFTSICNKKSFFSFILLFSVAGLSISFAQSNDMGSEDQNLKRLRSDVGIIGITANFQWLSSFTYFGDEPLASDGTSELEFVFRDVRTMSPHAAVGFQVLTSFYAGDSFGIGSWGLGPVLRGYPLKSEQWQPYFEADALFGNNMAVGELADTQTGGDGFRIRLGLRGGLAYRLSNSLGLFLEAGPDWESSKFFTPDVRVLQVNVGIDLYRFN